MEQALFHPATGYYAKRIRTVGRSGDFSTSATINGLLGTAIAGWLKEGSSTEPRVHHVIEVGAGDGSLSQAVRQALGWWTRRKFSWAIVESSSRLTELQKSKLSDPKVRWFPNMTEALTACAGSAFIFHNELMDALPVSLVQWDASASTWQEVWLRESSGRWVEELRPHQIVASHREHFSALNPGNWESIPIRDGQRVELPTGAFQWLADWSPGWRSGAMLTIDYGDVFPALYRRRPKGTLRAYAAHQTLTGPSIYENMGRQDITADVNFTDLRNWAQTRQWIQEPLETQRNFLLRHTPRNATSDPASRFLLDEFGAGNAFKVLQQRPSS